MYKLRTDRPLTDDDLMKIELEGNRAEELGDCPYLNEGPARDRWLRGFHSPRNPEWHPHEAFHREL